MGNQRKPVNIIYGLDDHLPVKVAIPLVIQQIVVLSIDLVLPVLMIGMIGGSRAAAQNLVSTMMIGIGIGTLLQALRKGPVGSGYLCAEETGFLYFQSSALAIQTGGLPLLFGMTSLAGLFQLMLSKIIQRVRFLFPAEVAGLMVAMTGIAGISPGVAAIFGTGDMKPVLDTMSTLIGLTTLAVMVGLNIWGNTIMRQYSILTGMVLGYVLSFLCGILTVSDMTQLFVTPLVAMPSIQLNWTFDGRLLLPFLVAAVCSSLKTMGNLVICQKANDANWSRIDLQNVGKGIFAEGVGTTLCGLIGCMGLNSSSSSVGLAMTTGVTSRQLAYFTSGVFIVMAFLPITAALLAIMPAPVMGAVLLINLGYFIVEGFRIITARMLDDRKIFVVGLSLILGLSVDLLPGIYAQFPVQLQPLFKSSLTVVSLTAIALNLLFRIGIQQNRVIELILGADSAEKVIDFMEANGAAWGARREVVHRATSTIIEFLETAIDLELVSEGRLKLDISFDEYQLDVKIVYNGVLLEFPERCPTGEELLDDDSAFRRLSGYLMRKYPSRIKSGIIKETCILQFSFEH